MARISTIGPGGVLQRSSPSAIDLFRNCPRKWGFRYILKLSDPPSAAQLEGTAGHDRIEKYCTTGEATLTEREHPARVWIPKPNTAGIFVEEDSMELHAAGIPINCKLDITNLTGVYVDPRGRAHHEAFPEFIDWKYTSNLKWAKDPRHETRAVQTICYARRVEMLPHRPPSHVRASFVYLQRKGRPAAVKLTTKLASDEIARGFGGIETTIQLMTEAAKATDPNDLPPNYDFCHAYNTPCNAINKCARGVPEALQSILKPSNGANTMSILDVVTNGAPAAPDVAPPTTPAPSATISIDDLLAQEKSEKTPTYLKTIEALRNGWPKFGGEVRGLVAGKVPTLDGEGTFKAMSIESWEDFTKLATLCAEKLGTPLNTPTTTAPLTTPDAPTAPVPAVPLPPEEAATLPADKHAAIAAKQAVFDAAQAAANPPPAPPAPPVIPPPAPPGRPPEMYDVDAAELEKARKSKKPTQKGQIALLRAECNRLREQIAGTVAGNGLLTDAQHADGRIIADLEDQIAALQTEIARGGNVAALEVFVDCDPDFPTTRLDAYVDGIMTKLKEGGGVGDFYAVEDSHVYAFGKWRSYVRRAIEANPPAPGQYRYRSGGEEARVVIETLAKLGARIVRGS